MKATIKTQGQQFAVSEGDVLFVNRYPNTEAGSIVEITEVLSSGEGAAFKVGTPTLQGAKVTAKILENKRGPKIVVFKMRKRKGYRRKQGHRQEHALSLAARELKRVGAQSGIRIVKPHACERLRRARRCFASIHATLRQTQMTGDTHRGVEC